MTNNFDLFKEYVQTSLPNFDQKPDSYLVIEIIRRGKDHSELSAANYHFKSYYINNLNSIDKYKGEIIQICDTFKMRAYFSIGRKSYHQVTLDSSAEFARRIATHDYKKPYSIFEHCSDKYRDNSDKRWVVDIDEGLNPDDYISLISEEKIITKIPTKSGIHLITRPFRRDLFWKSCEEKGLTIPDIKQNHISLLYENL